jgi:hypothetical protein
MDDVIVGHGISLLRWRSGGVKHPHDMPPFRFPPSPTLGDSSYFTKREGFGEGLEIADDDGPLTEFVLEKREVLRRHVGALQRLSAGRLIGTYSVRRRSK